MRECVQTKKWRVVYLQRSARIQAPGRLVHRSGRCRILFHTMQTFAIAARSLSIFTTSSPHKPTAAQWQRCTPSLPSSPKLVNSVCLFAPRAQIAQVLFLSLSGSGVGT